MPQFAYKAKKGPHEVVHGELEAADEERAIEALTHVGLIPIQVQFKNMISVKPPPKEGTDGRVKRSELTPFVRNLANLIQGNVPILRALSLLAKQSSGAMSGIAMSLRDSVRDGLSLSQAMERHPRAFPSLWIAMVRGGESAGVLGVMLEKLADHEEKEEELRRKVRGALVYPLVVLGMGLVTVFVLLTYFMPRLIGVYIGNQQKLPLPTALVLGVSQFLSSNWYWLLGSVLLIAAIVRRMGGASRRTSWDGIKLRIPFLRDLTLKSSWVHFSRTLGLLLAHGVPLSKGVSLAAATVDNSVLSSQLTGLEEALVKRGESLAIALKKIPQCPAMTVDLISVGEESGSLAASLAHIANTYEKDLEALLKTFATLLEPVLILAIGSVIGFIVFAMLMPIFQMDVFVD